MSPADVDAVEAAGALFDDPAEREWARWFLDRPGHHLCIASENGHPAGFVSGVEMIHPDKGAEMFLYELGVLESFRRKGIGRALVAALGARARQLGCYGMWTLTESENQAAVATYRSAGAVDRDEEIMLTWRLDEAHRTFTDPV